MNVFCTKPRDMIFIPFQVGIKKCHFSNDNKFNLMQKGRFITLGIVLHLKTNCSLIIAVGSIVLCSFAIKTKQEKVYRFVTAKIC